MRDEPIYRLLEMLGAGPRPQPFIDLIVVPRSRLMRREFWRRRPSRFAESHTKPGPLGIAGDAQRQPGLRRARLIEALGGGLLTAVALAFDQDTVSGIGDDSFGGAVQDAFDHRGFNEGPDAVTVPAV